MAYDANKDKERQDQEHVDRGAYTSALEGGGGGMPQATVQPFTGGLSLPDAGPQGVGKTATGFVNFGDVYQANADAAKAGAKRLQTSAASKAQGAQQGLTGAQQQFGQAVRTGTVNAPTADQQTWANKGATGVEHGKQVKDAFLYAPGMSTHEGSPGLGGKNVAGQHRDSEVTQSNAGSDDDMRRQLAQGLAVTDKDGKVYNSLAEWDAAHQTGGTPGDPTQDYTTESGEGLTSGVTRDSGGSTPDPTDDTFYDTKNDPALEQAVRAGAAAKYSGPGSLSDLASYQKLLEDTQSAQQGVDILGNNAGIQAASGGTALDAGLLGAAGRPGFADLEQKYGGNKLTNNLNSATLASRSIGDAARTQSAEDEKAYQQLLDTFQGRQSAEQGQEDAATQGSADKLAAAQKGRDDQLAYNDAMNGGDAFQKARNVVHGIGFGLNPVDWALKAAGQKTITEGSTDYFGKAFGQDKSDQFNQGNRSAAWGSDDADVFGSMTPADWTEFNGMSEADQRAWIAERKKKLRGGG